MTQAGSLTVDVQVACESPDIPSDAQICEWISRTVDAAGTLPPQGAEVSVRVVDTDEMRALNRDYREQDKVTNVLSFPAGEVAGLPDDAPKALGDIVICAAVVREEAVAQGKELAAHWAHMLVHGALHLIGYDHEEDAEALEMEGVETRILSQYGCPDPYLES